MRDATELRDRRLMITRYLIEKYPSAVLYNYNVKYHFHPVIRKRSRTDISNRSQTREGWWLGVAKMQKKYWERLILSELTKYAKEWDVELRHTFDRDNLRTPSVDITACTVATMWLWDLPFKCIQVDPNVQGLLISRCEHFINTEMPRRTRRYD